MHKTVVCDDGVTLSYDIHGCGHQSVILLHGLGGSTRTWQQILPLLDQTRFRWIIPEARGHGQSGCTLESFVLARFAQDVVDIQNNEGIESSHVIGLSAGCRTAAFLASTQAHRVSKLIFLAPPGFGVVPIPREMVKNICSRLPDRALLSQIWAPYFHIRIPGQLELTVESTALIPLAAFEKICEMWMYTPLTEIANGVRQPVCVVTGRYDPLYTIEFQERETLATLPLAELRIVDCGHFIPLELPEALSKITHDFFSAQRKQ